MCLDQTVIVASFLKGSFEAVNQIVDVTRFEASPSGIGHEGENLSSRPPSNQRVFLGAALFTGCDELKENCELLGEDKFVAPIDGNHDRAISPRLNLKVVRHMTWVERQEQPSGNSTAAKERRQLPLEAVEPLNLALKATAHKPQLM